MIGEIDLLVSERDAARADAIESRLILKKARAEVERLTKERDEAKALADAHFERGKADWDLAHKSEADAQRWRDAVARNAARLAELKAENPQRLPSPIDAVVDEVLFGGPDEHVSPPYRFAVVDADEAQEDKPAHLKFDGDSIPASHAEKVLVDVAKSAARLGAEEMRRRAVVLCRDRAMRAGAKKNEHATSGDRDAVRAWFYDQTTSEALASAIGCIDAKEPTP